MSFTLDRRRRLSHINDGELAHKIALMQARLRTASCGALFSSTRKSASQKHDDLMLSRNDLDDKFINDLCYVLRACSPPGRLRITLNHNCQPKREQSSSLIKTKRCFELADKGRIDHADFPRIILNCCGKRIWGDCFDYRFKGAPCLLCKHFGRQPRSY